MFPPFHWFQGTQWNSTISTMCKKFAGGNNSKSLLDSTKSRLCLNIILLIEYPVINGTLLPLDPGFAVTWNLLIRLHGYCHSSVRWFWTRGVFTQLPRVELKSQKSFCKGVLFRSLFMSQFWQADNKGPVSPNKRVSLLAQPSKMFSRSMQNFSRIWSLIISNI